MIENNEYCGLTEGTTRYHADYMSPQWTKDFTLIDKVSEHIFIAVKKIIVQLNFKLL